MHSIVANVALSIDRRTDGGKEAMSGTVTHKPVMCAEVLSALALRPGQVLVDATLGLGGHAVAILAEIVPGGRLIGIDRDEEALALARGRLEGSSACCDIVHDDFRHLDRILDRCRVDGIDGALFDLGVSSYQLETPERGFSFQAEGPLDMRMDRHGFISAYDLVNTLTQEELASILYKFGEERFSRRIAQALVGARRRAPIASTRQLADIVRKATPFKARRRRIHPATRTFQALRIAVNRELEGLDEALKKTAVYLNEGGRCAVIAFHSLEDRVVKENFKALEKTGRFRRVAKKVVRPAASELHENPRSRSARLRVIERIS